MKHAFILLTSLLIGAQSFCQCSNGFKKLFPESALDYSLNFGSSVSMYANYLAVGIPDSDSLGRESGIVYIYEKKNDAWKKIASMIASQPVLDLRLGINVKLSNNYLLVSAEADGGQVFIYKKSPSGWTSATEQAILTVTGSSTFGTAYSHPLDISDDENTIVVADAMKPHNSNPISIAGSLYVFHKNTGEPWQAGVPLVEIKATTDVADFGRAGVYLSGNRVITGTPFTASGHGNAYVYHDPSGNFSNFSLEALLSMPPDYSAWMDNLVVFDDGIMWSASGKTGLELFFFEKPADGAWVNAVPTYTFDPDLLTDFGNADFIHLATNGKDVYATTKDLIGRTYLTLLKKGTSGWSAPIKETIDSNLFRPNRFGAVIAANQQTDITVGYVMNPSNMAVQNALVIYSRTPPINTWAVSATLHSTNMSTRNHSYGGGMTLQDDFLFVSAKNDNTQKANGGKVYIYKKNGTLWNKMSAIYPSPNIYYNARFGSALAANNNFVAIGAPGWGAAGRVFIYKKTRNDWSETQLFQEIIIPSSSNTVISYGDNLAMNDRWLLIPYGDQNQNSSVDTKVAIYEYSDDSWTLRSTVTTGYYNIFAKSTTVGVAIEGNVFVASSKVFELSASGNWLNSATLLPKDPEGLRFNYPLFELLQNGSDFGQVVAIKNNTIFIGAPRRDYENTWDVGAVYVYKNQPGAAWTTRFESVKIIPNEKQESGLFGTAIFPFENSVLIGAPVSESYASRDFNGGNPIHLPGKVMLFETSNQLWTSVYQSKTFTGEMNGHDNFGIKVAVSGNDIIIAASQDDTPTGRTSGALYVTDIPMTVTPVPDVCIDSEIITLQARPTGGVWSGKGITDAALGAFSPSVAREGIHEISYTIAGCPSIKTNINVSPQPAAILLTNKEFLVCQEATNIAVPLKVTPIVNCSYQWFFRERGKSFVSLNQNEPSISAMQRGDYKVKVYNQACEIFSDTISIRNELIDLQVDRELNLCGTPPDGLQLKGLPTGGTWSGSGIRMNRFFVGDLVNGRYAINYRYTSPLGCSYLGQTNVNIKRLDTPDIMRTGNLCQEGSATLSLVGSPQPDVIYAWSKRIEGSNSYKEQATGSSMTIVSQGNYRLSLKKGSCEAASSIDVNDSFSMKLTPEKEKSEACHESEFQFALPSDPLATYAWYYSTDGKQPGALPETGNSIQPAKTGYYQAIVQRGVCSFTSSAKYIYIHSKDSVFVPNVLTPNGDGKNDTFQITVSNKVDNEGYLRYSILNRWGEEVYTSPDNRAWDGGDHSAGIYYWLGTYNTCAQGSKTIKGWVSLMR